MCPSFEATRNEKDSTRGRARVLQEMVDGRLVRDGWRSPEVHEALDRSVVRRLVELLRWRATEPAFDGDFELLDSDDQIECSILVVIGVSPLIVPNFGPFGL